MAARKSRCLLLPTIVVGICTFAIPDLTIASSLQEQWHRLLHYDAALGKSRVDNPHFFVSPEGQENPDAELQAFIAALKNPSLRFGALNLPVDCAFPARARWVRSQIDKLPPAPKCSEWQKWRAGLNGRFVSLVYTSSYTGSPGSMFGHTFLKVGPHQNDDSSLLNYSISYAANTEDAGAVSYIWHGLTGGFSGKVSVKPYYLKVKEYSLSEHRDLWEYPLDLTLEQVELLIAHTWELYTSGGFAYYFLDENCAGILLAILDVARPDWNLWDRRPLTITPLTAVQLVYETEGAVKHENLRPAPSKQINHILRQLNDQQQAEVQKILHRKTQIPPLPDPGVLEATIAILQAKKFNLEGNLDRPDAHILEASLSQRAKLPFFISPPEVPKFDHSGPIDAHKPAALSSAWIIRQTQMRVTLRHGYHDLGDAPAGYDEHLAITYLAPSVLLSQEQARFESLTILNMSALAPWQQFDQSPSWQVSSHCTQIYCDLVGGAGISLPLPRHGVAYALPKIALNSQGWWHSELQFDVGAIWRWLHLFTFDTQVIFHQATSGKSYWSGRLASRFQLHKNFQLMQNFDSVEGVSLGFRQFF